MRFRTNLSLVTACLAVLSSMASVQGVVVPTRVCSQKCGSTVDATQKGCAVQKPLGLQKCQPVQKCQPAPKSCAAQKSCGCGSSCGIGLLEAIGDFFSCYPSKCGCSPACGSKSGPSKCDEGGPPSSLPMPVRFPESPQDAFEDEAEPPMPMLDDGAAVGSGEARTSRSTWRPTVVPRLSDPTVAPQNTQPRDISGILR